MGSRLRRSEQDYLQMFLEAKGIEGCSAGTIQYAIVNQNNVKASHQRYIA